MSLKGFSTLDTQAGFDEASMKIREAMSERGRMRRRKSEEAAHDDEESNSEPSDDEEERKDV